MADIFISYKREERGRVERIAERLRGLGLSVWFDSRLPSGQSFDEEINREIRAAKCVLVCWSPAAIESEWVRAEASIGRDRNVLAAAMLAPTQLYAPFNLIHADDLTDWDGADLHHGWLALQARIGELVGRPDMVARGREFMPVSAKRRPKRRGLPVWATMLVVAALLIGGGYVGYRMLNRPTDKVFEVVFDSSTPTDLNVGVKVRFNGVEVGEVESLRLDPEDPARVIPRIRVSNMTPIRTDTTARLVGLVDRRTGDVAGKVIDLNGADPRAPLLRMQPGTEMPRIPGTVTPGGARVALPDVVEADDTPAAAAPATAPPSCTPPVLSAEVFDVLMTLDRERLAGLLRRCWTPDSLLDSERNTALHALMMVCERNPSHDRARLADVARDLIAAGADAGQPNKWGDTPAMIARTPKYCGPSHPVLAVLEAAAPGH